MFIIRILTPPIWGALCRVFGAGWGVNGGIKFAPPLSDAVMHDHFINMILVIVRCESINVSMKKQKKRELCSLMLLNMKMQLLEEEGRGPVQICVSDQWLSQDEKSDVCEKSSQGLSQQGTIAEHPVSNC